MHATIVLNNGLHCLVDEGDYEAAMQFHWTPYCYRGIWYAQTSRVGSMHRWLMNYPTGRFVDHRNRNGIDNRRSNLRLATVSQNAMNARVVKGVSAFKGVTLERRGRWRARIKIDGVRHSLGQFSTALEAANAYDVAALRIFGEFAAPNFPERFK
jgi:hypothetical protein